MNQPPLRARLPASVAAAVCCVGVFLAVLVPAALAVTEVAREAVAAGRLCASKGQVDGC
jgi:hypothetical protein